MERAAAPPLVFAGALAVMVGVFFFLPRAAPIMGLALVMGALYAAEQAAKAKNIAGPLGELGAVINRR